MWQGSNKKNVRSGKKLCSMDFTLNLIATRTQYGLALCIYRESSSKMCLIRILTVRYYARFIAHWPEPLYYREGIVPGHNTRDIQSVWRRMEEKVHAEEDPLLRMRTRPKPDKLSGITPWQYMHSLPVMEHCKLFLPIDKANCVEISLCLSAQTKCG